MDQVRTCIHDQVSQEGRVARSECSNILEAPQLDAEPTQARSRMGHYISVKKNVPDVLAPVANPVQVLLSSQH